jgi:hypothetical protein
MSFPNAKRGGANVRRARLVCGLAALAMGLAAAGSAAAVCPPQASYVQPLESAFLNLPAEGPSLPSAWTYPTLSGAYHNRGAKAPANNGGDLTYRIQFTTQGNYRLYVRGRGTSGNNTILVPGGGNPEATPNTVLDSGTTWAWRNDSVPDYVIGPSNVNRPLTFRIRFIEPNVELDEVFFAKVGAGTDKDAPYHHQQAPDGSVVIDAEEYDYLGSSTGWQVAADATAHERAKLFSASSTGTTTDYAAYRVNFSTPGNYLIYVRTWASQGQGSVYLPSTPGTTPTQITYVPDDSFWHWSTCSSCSPLTIAAAGPAEIRIRVRTAALSLDSVVIVPAPKTEEELDAMGGYWEAELMDGFQTLNFRGDYLTFPGVPPTDELFFRYTLNAAAESKRASLYVDGTDVDTVIFAPTVPWDPYATTRVRGTFEGEVELRIDPDDEYANGGTLGALIDRVSLRDAGRDRLVRSVPEFSAAADCAQPGDTLVLDDGVALNGAELNFAPSGTADLPITIRSRTVGTENFTASTILRVTGSHVTLMDLVFGGAGNWPPPSTCLLTHCGAVMLSGAHDRLTNVLFDGYYPEAVLVQNPDYPNDPTKKVRNQFHMVTIEGDTSTHARVDHSAFREHVSRGATLFVKSASTAAAQLRYVSLDRNFFGERPWSNENAFELIRLGAGSVHENVPYRTTVSESYFEHYMTETASGVGEGESISNKSSDNRFLSNTFFDVRRNLTMRSGQRALVHGNYFVESEGLRIYGEGHRILNNYFYRSLSPAIEIGNGTKNGSAVSSGGGCSVSAGYDVVKDLGIAFNTFEESAQIITVGDSKRCLLPSGVVIANNVSRRGALSGSVVRYVPGLTTTNVTQTDAQMGNGIQYFSNYFDHASHEHLVVTPDSTEDTDSDPQEGAVIVTTSYPAALSVAGDTIATTNFLDSQLVNAANPSWRYGLTTDIDGQLRVTAFDVGADEVLPADPEYATIPSDSNTGPSWWLPLP